MKATFLRLNRTTDAFPRTETVEYSVTFDENEEYPKGTQKIFIFKLDKNYLPISAQLAEEDMEMENINHWQLGLLYKVKDHFEALDKENNEKLNDPDWTFVQPKLQSYYSVTLADDSVSWVLETEDEATSDCFTNAWNSITETASEAFDSISKATASFFSAKPVENYFFFPRVSNFKPEQITKIEALINQLNKEINSVWYPNEKLKTAKRDGLIQMLEQSRKDIDIREIISNTMAIPGMIEGCRSRTRELLNELQDENKSPIVSL